MEFVSDFPNITLSGDEPELQFFAVVMLRYCSAVQVLPAAEVLTRELDSRRREQGRNGPCLGLLVSEDDFPVEYLLAAVRKAASQDIYLRHLPMATLERAQGRGQAAQFMGDVLKLASEKDPYAYSLPVSSEGRFFGHVNRLARLLEVFREPRPILLHGIRSAGKTSFALRLQIALNQAGWLTPALVRRPKTAVLGRTLAQLLRNSYIAAGRERPHFLDAADATVSVERFSGTLSDLHEELKRERAEKPILLVLDEVEDLTARASGTEDWLLLFDFLESVLDLSDRNVARFLFISVFPELSWVDLPPGIFTGSGNPLHQKCYLAPMEPLEAHEARELLVNLGASIGLAWEDAALEKAVQVTGGYPHLLRLLGSSALAATRRDGKSSASVGDFYFDKSLEELLNSDVLDSYFEELTERLGPLGHDLVELISDGSPPRDQAIVRAGIHSRGAARVGIGGCS